MKLLHDAFSRTYLPAAAAAQIPLPLVNRHAAVLRRCAGTRDNVTFVAPCYRSNEPLGRGAPSNLLMVTSRRLVVTTQSPVLRRLRLHLSAALDQLADVTWTAEPQHNALRLSLTAMDGVREHFWIRMGDAEQLRRLNDTLTVVFRRSGSRQKLSLAA
jgi:hypothetical protein